MSDCCDPCCPQPESADGYDAVYSGDVIYDAGVEETYVEAYDPVGYETYEPVAEPWAEPAVEPVYVEQPYVEPASVDPGVYVEPAVQASAVGEAAWGGGYAEMPVVAELAVAQPIVLPEPVAMPVAGYAEMTVGGQLPVDVFEHGQAAITGANEVVSHNYEPISIQGWESSLADPSGVPQADPAILAAHHRALGNTVLGTAPDGTSEGDYAVPAYYTQFLNDEPGLIWPSF